MVNSRDAKTLYEYGGDITRDYYEKILQSETARDFINEHAPALLGYAAEALTSDKEYAERTEKIAKSWAKTHGDSFQSAVAVVGSAVGATLTVAAMPVVVGSMLLYFGAKAIVDKD